MVAALGLQGVHLLVDDVGTDADARGEDVLVLEDRPSSIGLKP
ncbi:MAG: hypothetical protein WDN09_02725 [bacterium]